MRFKVGTKVVCTNVYSGGDFGKGDVVEIKQIGCEEEPDCYGAISPHDGHLWYLYEDEVKAATNADHIRGMSDEQLRDFLYSYKFFEMCDEGCEKCNYKGDCEKRLLDWLRKPVEVEAEKAN